jgi:hypothetical protein
LGSEITSWRSLDAGNLYIFCLGLYWSWLWPLVRSLSNFLGSSKLVFGNWVLFLTIPILLWKSRNATSIFVDERRCVWRSERPKSESESKDHLFTIILNCPNFLCDIDLSSNSQSHFLISRFLFPRLAKPTPPSSQRLAKHAQYFSNALPFLSSLSTPQRSPEPPASLAARDHGAPSPRARERAGPLW